MYFRNKGSTMPSLSKYVDYGEQYQYCSSCSLHRNLFLTLRGGCKDSLLGEKIPSNLKLLINF